MPTILTATYKIVTPMFIGDANQHADSLRPPAFKGAMRFWWRALNWNRILTSALNELKQEQASKQALKNLHKEESLLFGTAMDSKDKTLGQSKFLLRIKQLHNYSKVSGNQWPKCSANNQSSGSQYLGFGLFRMRNNEERNAFEESDKDAFTVELILRSTINAEQKQQLHDVLIAIGLFGGLGSRARHGFGSIALTTLDGENLNFDTNAAYEKRINSLLTIKSKQDILPPYTAISYKTKFILGKPHENARKAHNTVGEYYQEFRERYNRFERKIFGLPLTKVSEERRASPLFIHIHPIKNGGYISLLLLIPAVFHHQKSLDTTDYSLIHKFMNEVEQGANQ